MKSTKCFYLLVVVFIIFAINSHCIASNEQSTDYSNLDQQQLFVSFSQTGTHEYLTLAKLDEPASSSEDDDALLDEFEDSEESEPVSDPLYYFNYAMYSFNDFMYHAALNPIASGYEAVTPTVFRKGVRNFFHNLLFPVRFVNNLLQGEIIDAGTEVEIFLINSTVGVLGLAQVAQEGLDIKTNDEDLGQTFGKWGMGEGCYLVLPFLGPSSLRDSIGLVGDSFLKPVNYVEPWELSLGLTAYDKVNTLTFHLGEYESLKKASLDPYVAIRDAYIQNRNSKIKE